MCCNVLQCVAVYCSVLQPAFIMCYNMPHCITVGCRVLQRVAVSFSIYILQLCIIHPSCVCVDQCVCVLQRVAAIKQSILNPCHVAIVEKMQMSPYTATYCNTLQHTATHCNNTDEFHSLRAERLNRYATHFENRKELW